MRRPPSGSAPTNPLVPALLLALLLAACGTPPRAPAPQPSAEIPAKPPRTAGQPGAPALPAAGSGRGGYYLDDGPGDTPPPNLLAVPDAEVTLEPYSRTGNKPYVVFGKTYVPQLDEKPFMQRGVASWYGKKFHGQRTSSGEPYDMYKMTAAHPTLPIPSYARVTNLANGKQVIVRVNDRGPFHSSRVMDLSYTAALKLGYLGTGSREVQIERILPAEAEAMIAQRRRAVVGNTAIAAVRQPAPAAASGSKSAVEAMLRGDAPVDLPAEAAPALAQADVPAAEPALTPVAAKGGYYLQLGAYAQEHNAEATRQTLRHDALPGIEMVRQGALYKLFGGPYASRAEALQAARKLRDEKWSGTPVVIER
jgi:rare lipoprotein A